MDPKKCSWNHVRQLGSNRATPFEICLTFDSLPGLSSPNDVSGVKFTQDGRKCPGDSIHVGQLGYNRDSLFGNHLTLPCICRPNDVSDVKTTQDGGKCPGDSKKMQ